VCYTCGCMDAHLVVGQHNITYEDMKAAADENGQTIAETLALFEQTLAQDREDHPDEYPSA
jgi:hypothetical protein